MTSACCSCVPCEKLRRATSMPAFSSASSTFGEDDAGPIVQTIFVLRMHSQRSAEARAFDSRLFDGARLLRVADHVKSLYLPPQFVGKRRDGRRARKPDHVVDPLERLL